MNKKAKHVRERQHGQVKPGFAWTERPKRTIINSFHKRIRTLENLLRGMPLKRRHSLLKDEVRVLEIEEEENGEESPAI